MISLHDQLLYKDRMNTHRTVQIPTKDEVVTASDNTILVRWKGEFQWRKADFVGDSMELIRIFERPFMTYDLDHKACGEWMTLYREFDEDSGVMRSYLYGFGTDAKKREQMNVLLQSVHSPLHLEQNGNFIECVGHDDLDHACALVRLWGWKVLYSFMFWLFLGYGSFVGDESTMHHATIKIPMVGTIPACEEVLTKVVQSLSDHGVMIRSSYSSHGAYQTLEIGVYDWELLFHFHKWTTALTQYTTVAKREKIKVTKAELLEFLDQVHAPKECIKVVSRSVLKLHTVQFP